MALMQKYENKIIKIIYLFGRLIFLILNAAKPTANLKIPN